MSAAATLAFLACAAAAKKERALPLPANTSIVALRFHKVASTTFRDVLDQVQPSFMEHSTLVAYRTGGLPQLRCLGAPKQPRVVFVALLREPLSRILSALHFYAGYAGFGYSMLGGGALSLGRRPAKGDPAKQRQMEEFAWARTWLRETQSCAGYTGAGVARAMAVLSSIGHATSGRGGGSGRTTAYVKQMVENLGAGAWLNEYAWYLNVVGSADVAPALARLRREFVVGVTEDMPHLAEEVAKAAFPAGPLREAAVSRMRGALAAPRLRSGNGTSILQSIPGACRQPGSCKPTPYCTPADLPKAEIADLRRLASLDVAIYEGVRSIAATQRAESWTAPTGDFGRAYGSTDACLHGEAIRHDDPNAIAPAPPGPARRGRGDGATSTALLLWLLPLGIACLGACMLAAVCFVARVLLADGKQPDKGGRRNAEGGVLVAAEEDREDD